MDQSDVRRHHLSIVVEALLRDGPLSRADLAQRIGLTKGTVSALVNDLLERELVEEHDVRPGGRVGRPAVDLDVASWSVGGLGLEINVDYVAACIVDLAGKVRVRYRRGGDNQRARRKQVVDRLRRVANKAMNDAEADGIRCVGAGLAVPGLVGEPPRLLYVAPNLHWLDVDLTSLDLGLPSKMALTVDNEANLAALGELRYGAARDLSSFVYVSGGVGIGGGVVVDGRLMRGNNGFAGELGHVVVDPDGPLCACGAHGCLEACAGAGVAASPKRIADALAIALRSIVHLVDPQAVVLGGTLAAVDDVVERVGARLRDETLGGRWRPCEVRRSALGADAALVGAAATVLDDVVADPTLVPAGDAEQTA